jgi:hypothetical protein
MSSGVDRHRRADRADTKTRPLVPLPDDDKHWLDAEASARRRPMTHPAQDAVAEYRVGSASRRGETLRHDPGLATRDTKDFRPARFPFAPSVVRR